MNLLQHLLHQFQLAVVAQLLVFTLTIQPPNCGFTQVQTPQQGEMISPPMNTQDDMITAPNGPLELGKINLNRRHGNCIVLLHEHV